MVYWVLVNKVKHECIIQRVDPQSRTAHVILKNNGRGCSVALSHMFRTPVETKLMLDDGLSSTADYLTRQGYFNLHGKPDFAAMLIQISPIFPGSEVLVKCNESSMYSAEVLFIYRDGSVEVLFFQTGQTGTWFREQIYIDPHPEKRLLGNFFDVKRSMTKLLRTGLVPPVSLKRISLDVGYMAENEDEGTAYTNTLQRYKPPKKLKKCNKRKRSLQRVENTSKVYLTPRETSDKVEGAIDLDQLPNPSLKVGEENYPEGTCHDTAPVL